MEYQKALRGRLSWITHKSGTMATQAKGQMSMSAQAVNQSTPERMATPRSMRMSRRGRLSAFSLFFLLPMGVDFYSEFDELKECV